MTPHLSPVIFKQEETLIEGHATHAYFLEDGVASVVVGLQDGATVEVGVIGVDGLVGLPFLLGGNGVPGWTFIQIAGSGFSIRPRV